jgi:hypothetical protein
MVNYTQKKIIQYLLGNISARFGTTSRTRSFQKFVCFPSIYTSLLLSSLQIEEIFVAPEYSTQNHFADIAVIVTDRAFKLSPTVQPVAVDWAKAHVDKVLHPSRQFGYVSFELCFILPFFI